jgi:hypothetical protein
MAWRIDAEVIRGEFMVRLGASKDQITNVERVF